MMLRSLIGPALLLMIGCQTLPTLGWSEAGPEATSVMTLWKTYEHCRTTGDIDAKEGAALQLAAAAQKATVIQESPIPLPQILLRHVLETAPRYSVDPQALSASCSLEAGNAALRIGQHRLAANMFQFVLVTYPQTEYAYYTRQAQRGLRHIELRRMVSTPPDPHVLPVSSSAESLSSAP